MSATSTDVLPATLCVFCGGKSTRMGRDKALLDWGGEPLGRAVARRLAPLFCDVLISGDPRRFSSLGYRCVPDRVPAGPLAGLHAVLSASSTPAIFAVACDMPAVQADTVLALWDRFRARDAVVPVGPAGPEPLCAFYARRILPCVSRALEGKARLTGWWGEAWVERVPVDSVPGGAAVLADCDTREAYLRMRRAVRLPDSPPHP